MDLMAGLTDLFAAVVQMSLTGSIVILLVCLARLLLKRAPKWISYVLWSVVLFRLLCPMAVASPVSLIPRPVSEGKVLSDWADDYTGDIRIFHQNNDGYDAAIEAGRQPVDSGEGEYYTVTAPDGVSQPETVYRTVFPVLGMIWLAGTVGMLSYAGISALRLRKKLAVSVPAGCNIRLSDDIPSPFVWGILFPKIYLPSGFSSDMSDGELQYILLHEQCHIRRVDHLTRLLAYIALSIHWFNPLVWLAFVLSGRDMEMSCDEAVVGKLGEGIRADYSASLLRMSAHRRFCGGPLAFGEGDTWGRIRNLSRWKRPKVWGIVIAVVFVAILGTCLLTNPRPAQDTIRLLGVEDGSWSWNADFAVDIGRQTGSGRIYAEQWSDGECVKSTPVSFTRYLEQLEVITSFDRENGSVSIQIDTGQYGGSLLTSFQLPEEKQAVGWSFTSFEEGEKIAVQPDTEQILAALAFDMGNGVQVFDCESLTREPERLEQAEYIVVIRACFDSEMEEGQAESETSEQPKPVLQLSDVTALSGKGEALSWADFEQYDCIETGSGLYIRLYPIDEMFTLSIGGAGPESEPMYIYLSAKDGTDENIDIRTGDVEEYIRQHQDNPVVTDCSYSWQLSPVGFSDEAFFQMFGMDPENTGSPAVSAIRFLPVIRLESVEELDTFFREMETELSFDQTAPGLVSFSEAIQEYDQSFFESNDLLLVYAIDGTEECLPGMAYLRRREDTLSVGISCSQQSAGGGEGWLVSIAVARSELEGITSFDGRTVWLNR